MPEDKLKTKQNILKLPHVDTFSKQGLLSNSCYSMAHKINKVQ